MKRVMEQNRIEVLFITEKLRTEIRQVFKRLLYLGLLINRAVLCNTQNAYSTYVLFTF